MEAPTDLPPATRPAASIAYAANPTPNHAPNFNHPPYAEMITAAIVAMKEKDGSSRQAIAKYIENEYTSLSPSHSSLLTQQLKRMKNNGQLVLVKHSYMLPRSGSGQNSDGPKRRPGRPPNARPEIQPNGGGMIGVSPRVDGPPATFGQDSGLASTVQVGGPDTGVPTFDPIGAAPTMVPIEQVDGPVKRRPGRPPKASSVVVDADPVRSVPPSTVGKRRPGRPLKVNNALVGVGSGAPTLGKRSRGRPKLLSVLMGNSASKRGRGRPSRVVRPGIGQRARGRPKKVATGRPRGRPPKNVAVNGGGGGAAGLVAVNGTGDGVLPVKRAGRPPKTGEAKKPRKLGGKPLGRPKKNASVAAIQASEQQQQLIAYQELKGRVEHFQSRIKQAVSVVKPYLNNETAVIAVGALQELEELASMDIITQVTVQSAAVTVQSAPVTGTGTGQSAPVAVQSQSAPLTVQIPPGSFQSAPGYVQAAPGSVQNAPGYVQAGPGYVQSAAGYVQSAAGYVQSAAGYVQSAPGSVQNAPTSFQGQEHFFQN